MRDVDRLFPAGSAQRERVERLAAGPLPRHVAVIMDGNGRWAKHRGLPRVEGHRAGIRAVRESLETAACFELDALTLYAFSTENWKRPRWEVRTLMALLKEYLIQERQSLIDNNIRFRPIGRLLDLEPEIQQGLRDTVEATAANTGTVFQVALNYSGRAELVDAARLAATLATVGSIVPEDIDEAWVSSQLANAGLPDPDLLIRTSNELRISNFLLWQIAYTELYFTPVLWPDFGRDDFIAALEVFAGRERRFGGVLGAAGDGDEKG